MADGTLFETPIESRAGAITLTVPRSKTPHKIGTTSEAMFLAACVAMDIPVSIPYGINQRYDFIVDRGGLRRVQVKTAHLISTDKTLAFNTHSAVWNYGGTVRRTGDRRYIGQIDDFGVYSPQLKTVYLVPIERFGTKLRGYLRVTLFARETRPYLWAGDFLIYRF